MRYGFKDVVIDSRTGLNPRKNFVLGSGKNNYITIKDIYNGQINITDKTDKVDDDAIQIIKKRSRIKIGDILFVSIGRIGETAIVTCKDDTWDVNESVFVFTINRDIITPEYFCMLFQSEEAQKYLAGNSSGSTFKSIKMNQLEKMVFDLPSLEDQEEITAKLSKAKAICNLRTSELSQLDDLIKARFVEMFGDPVANTFEWKTALLREVTSKIGSGATPRGGKESYQAEGVTLIRSMNVHDGRFEYKDLAHITDEQAAQLDNVTVEEGDVFINITGASVARSCIVPKDTLPARVNQHVAIIRCVRDHLHPIFANNMFLNDRFKGQLLDIGESGGATRQAITKQQLEILSVVVPPMKLQEQFAAFVTQVDKSKVVVQNALEEAQLLFDRLMQEYFG